MAQNKTDKINKINKINNGGEKYHHKKGTLKNHPSALSELFRG
jgi:hypothetical protein